MFVPQTFKVLIFIAGAEGSGTTLLSRILSAPECCASLGGLHVKVPRHPEARALARAFEQSNKRVWDRRLPIAEHEQARQDWRETAQRVESSDAFVGRTHLVFKRSFPFSQPHGRFTPDLWDVLDLRPDARIVTIYRNPCAATYSALRRGFDSDLRRLAVVCAEQLSWLAAQVGAIGADRAHAVSYERLCAQPELEPVAAFCGLPLERLLDAAPKAAFDVEANLRFARELPRADADWLDGFFNERRKAQWAVLDPT